MQKKNRPRVAIAAETASSLLEELILQRPWYLRARLLLLLVAWCLVLFGGVTLHVLCDVFQGQPTEFPLVPCVFAAVLFNGLGAFIAAHVGTLTVEDFRLYQPFVGGQSFIVMQAFGYGALCIAEGLVCMYVHVLLKGTTTADVGAVLEQPLRFGILSILGTFPFVANISLLASLMFFVQPPLTPSRMPHTTIRGSTAAGLSRKVHFAPPSDGVDNVLHRWSKAPLREVALVISFCVAILLFASFGAVVPTASKVSVVLFLCLQLLNAVLIHVVIGWCYTPGYHLFMPILPSRTATLAQFVLWFLLVCSLYWGVIELQYPFTLPMRLLTLALGGVGVTTALLLFVRHCEFGRACHECKQTPSSRSMLAEYGPSTLTFTSFVHACMIWLTIETNTTESARGGLQESSEWSGWRVAQTVAAVFMINIPPATHLLGGLVLGPSFHVWQPFRGSPAFIAMQGLGWTSFGASYVACAAHFTSRDSNAVLLLSALSAFSQIMIHGSLLVFSDMAGDTEGQFPPLPDAKGVRRLFRAGSSPQSRPVSLVSALLNGEMLLALMIMTASMILRVVCDVATYLMQRYGVDRAADSGVSPSTVYFIVFMTTWMGAAATPLAHVSGRDKGISVFRPFGGSGPYVALQAVGWTLYSIALLASVISFVMHLQSKSSWQWTSDMVPQTTALMELPACWFTVDAMMWCIPLAMIIVSVAVETKQNWTKLSEEEQAWEAQNQLCTLMRTAIADDDDRARAMELLDTLMKPLWRDSTPWSAHAVVAAKATSARRGHGEVPMEEEFKRRQRLKEQQSTATLIICMTCVGTAVLFVAGALWLEREPKELSIGFAVSGFLLTTISCFATHYVYGTLIHGDHAYTFFMPFTGGASFISLQAVGWAFYTAATVLVLHSFLLHEGTLLSHLVAAVFSISAQALILGSIPRFRPSSNNERTVLERNSEALVAGLLFIASFSYAQTYHAVWGSGSIDDGKVADPPRDPSMLSGGLIPLVVSGVTSCFAIPLTIAAVVRLLKKKQPQNTSRKNNNTKNSSQNESTFQSSVGDGTEQEPITSGDMEDSAGRDHLVEHGSNSLPGSPSGRSSRRSTATPTHDVPSIMRQRVVEIIGLLSAYLLALLPVVLVFVYYFQRENQRVVSLGAQRATGAWFGITVVLGGIMLIGVVVDVLTSPQSLSLMARVRIALTTFALFSVPTYVVAGPLSLPVLFPCSVGAVIFTSHALILVVLGDFKAVRFMCSIVEVCGLGFTLSKHLANAFSEPLLTVAVDMILPMFMLRYHVRYHGAPERFGTLLNETFVMWLRPVFEAVGDYFTLKVIVDDKLSPTSSTHKERCWSTGPAIFSFHPHGVFPATTLLLPHTRAWLDKMHLPIVDNTRCLQKLSVHGAGVIFRVPFLRDFVMALGGRVVTRSAIETSLSQGNSVMIVTGGQAEMLKSKYSDHHMHLVAHHVGFLRLAVKHQVPVVPLVSFAENNVMDNVHLPWIQKKMLKLIGFPFPTIPHGRWYLPLPNRTPLSVVVGTPVNPPDGLTVDDEEGIKQFSVQYFSEVKNLFYKYRAECGYPDMELVLHW